MNTAIRSTEPIRIVEVIDEQLDRHDMATRDAMDGVSGAYRFLVSEVQRKLERPPESTRTKQLIEKRVEMRK